MAKSGSFNNNEVLKFLSSIFNLDVLDNCKVGFATITKVDTNTFTISDIDEDEFEEYIKSTNNKELVDEYKTSS